MKTAIVLAMHGVPPEGYPIDEITEIFRLHSQLEHMPVSKDHPMSRRYIELDYKIRSYPRTNENDPYWASAHRLAEKLREETGIEVQVGFNEFCNPTIDDAIGQLVSTGLRKIIVVTPMMTPGGEHSEVDIPEAIERAKKEYPEIAIVYAWPFNLQEVAKFLKAQIESYI